jgi:hypothetical protein
LFRWVSRTLLFAVVDVLLVCGDIVGAVALGVLNDGKGEFALVVAMAGAVAVRLIWPVVYVY